MVTLIIGDYFNADYLDYTDYADINADYLDYTDYVNAD
jgi:hypothetical protein